jgi:hypothetical protein
LTNDQIVTGHGTADLDWKRAGARGHVVLAAVRPNTRVRCRVDNRLVVDALVTSSLLVKDGLQLDEPVNGIRTLLVRLQFKRLPPPPRLARLPNGTYVVNKDVLRESLRSSSELPSVGKPQCDCVRHAAFSVKIGLDGHVTFAAKKLGDDDISEAVLRTVRDWVFTPITDAGRQIEAEGLITVLADRTGALRLLW